MIRTLVALVFFAVSIPLALADDFQLSTHVLDTTLGKPGVGVAVTLEKRAEDGTWTKVGQGTTDKDGRIKDFLKTEETAEHKGVYRFTFALENYFSSRGLNTVFPEAVIVFRISDETHYHIPLAACRT